MANSAPGGASDYNTKIIEEFRANEGRVDGPWAGTPMILIHHIGARSGGFGALPEQVHGEPPGVDVGDVQGEHLGVAGSQVSTLESACGAGSNFRLRTSASPRSSASTMAHE